MLRKDQGAAQRACSVLTALALSILAASIVASGHVGASAPGQSMDPAYDGFNLERAIRDSQRLIDRIDRTEEHTSELSSQSYLVCRLLLG